MNWKKKRNTSFGSSIIIIQNFRRFRFLLFSEEDFGFSHVVTATHQHYHASITTIQYLWIFHCSIILVAFKGDGRLFSQKCLTATLKLDWNNQNWILIDFCEHIPCAFACFLRFLFFPRPMNDWSGWCDKRHYELFTQLEQNKQSRQACAKLLTNTHYDIALGSPRAPVVCSIASAIYTYLYLMGIVWCVSSAAAATGIFASGKTTITAIKIRKVLNCSRCFATIAFLSHFSS